MKKEPLSIITIKTLLAVIIFAGIGTIIIGGGWLIGKNYENKAGNKTTESVQQQQPIKKEVTITTDKTEYEQGETVKITVENNLGGNIYYHENIYCYLEYKGGDKVWIISRAVNMPCLKGEMKEIKNGEVVYFNINFTKDGICHYFGEGKYRIAFDFRTDKGMRERGIVYSNEFTIKEKSALDPRCSEKVVGSGDCDCFKIGYEFDIDMGKCIEKGASGCSFEIPFNSLEECQDVCEKKEIKIVLTPDYVLSHSNELIGKTIQVRGVASAGFPSVCTEMFCGPDECCNDCSGPLLLVEKGSKRVDKNHAEIVLLGGNCFGNECILDKCYPLEKGKVYTVTGVWSEKGLSINEEFLYKSEF